MSQPNEPRCERAAICCVDGPALEVDSSGDAYLYLAGGLVERTVCVTDSVNVDYDSDGNVLGVELLGYLTHRCAYRLAPDDCPYAPGCGCD